jgi:DNA-binding protein HU-beta
MKENLNKIGLSKELSNKLGYSVQYSKKLINDFIDILSLQIKTGRKPTLINLGSFKLIFKSERMGRNPKTKKKYKISSRKSISFYAAKKLQKKINL